MVLNFGNITYLCVASSSEIWTFSFNISSIQNQLVDEDHPHDDENS